jgi:predicted ATP-binding protein involved in virulence
MRVKQISVKNLFGIFNHFIPLNMEERITIIHGPNGFGKTALLRLIDGLFNLRYSQLLSFPFQEFQVDFEDNSTLQIDQERLENATRLTFKLLKPGGETFSFTPRREANTEYSSPDFFKRYSWLLSQEGDKSDEDPSKPGTIERRYKYKISPEPKWLETIRGKIPVQFIKTQRLFSSEESHGTLTMTGLTANQPAVEKYAEELAGIINAKLAESAELSQSLDRSFPVRLVAEETPAALSATELRNRLSELEKERERLTAVGLLDKDGDSTFQLPTQIDETKRSVLSVYVNDVEKKLGVFNDIADRMELFKNIINRRFLYKQMTVNRERGFIFTTPDDRPLTSLALSSGEQHELVLFYELLFKVKPESLILIDEPELSLHVAWQQQFLEDLQEITRLTSIDVLIATHSPSIIHDRWDLTVELKGPAR